MGTSEEPNNHQASSKISLLLIEDDPENSLKIRMNLAEAKDQEFLITSTDKVEKGIRYLANHLFSAILLSTTLKNKNGQESLEEIQKTEPDIPVIIISNKINADSAKMALKKGAQDILIKEKIDPQIISKLILYAIERHRVLSDLRRKNIELERLNSLKTEFLSSVSHELKTPLSIILSANANLVRGNLGPITDQQKKWLEKIKEHSLRLEEMVSELLDLSRIQSGKTTLKRKNVNFPHFFKTILSNLQLLVKQKKVTLKLHDLPQPPPFVWCDPGRIDQVVTNLVTNALKYTPENGIISLKLEHKGPHLSLSISDNGPGIPPDQMEQIFERFHQVRTQDKNQSSLKGIGLGLAICKEIITLHKGKIWVESEPGKGSTFIFSIPLDPRAASRVQKILVVDDDEEICELIKETLQQAGFSVTIFINGTMAIKEIDNNEFDLAFIDLMLPGATGLEVIRKIKKKADPASIVVITAYPNSDMLLKAMKFGAMTILPKPFSTDALIGLAKNHLKPNSNDPSQYRAA